MDGEKILHKIDKINILSEKIYWRIALDKKNFSKYILINQKYKISLFLDINNKSRKFFILNSCNSIKKLINNCNNYCNYNNLTNIIFGNLVC